jgi:heat-inducible transcriptional repressor
MATGTVEEHMDDRLKSILCAIVENYIETVEPVGSRTLSKALSLNLSPATIRNTMADLTELGYLEQPHTSAGRVPTNRAYRYYVDHCIGGLGEDTLPGEVQIVIERSLNESSAGLAQLLNSATSLISGLTQFTGVVASPRISQVRLRMIEFLKINESQIYVVLITQSNMVHQKIIEASENLSQEFLNSVSEYLNEHFAASSLEDVREKVLESLVKEKENYDQLLAQAVRLSRKAFDIADERQLYVEGQSFIAREFDNLEKIRRLLEALEDKISLIGLLDETLDNPGVNITIGLDDPDLYLEDCSLVTAKYHIGNRALGAIGVIGPNRMNYGRIIPILDYTAKTLSAAIANQ